ncbi:MAG: O-antigen ligase family protein [Candidatus Omnitrophota bacterium]
MIKRFFLLFFAILLLIRPFLDGLTYPAAQNLFQFAVFGAVIIYAGLILTGRAAYQTIGLELPAAAFLLVSFAAAIGSASPHRSEVVFLQYLYYFSLFFLLFQVVSSPSPSPLPGGERVKRKEVDSRLFILTIILITAALVSLYGIHQYFWGFKDTLNYITQQNMLAQIPPDMMARLTSGRAFSTFVYPNIFAAFLITLIPVSLALKLPGLLLTLLFSATLFLTKSIGGLTVLLFTGLVWLAAFWSGKLPAPTGTAGPAKIPFRKIRPFVIIIGGALVLFYILTVSEKIPYRNILSLRDRFFYWASSLEIFKQRPVLGFGPGSFGVQYARFKIPAAMETQHSHSIFFEILAEQGLLGIVTFFWFWVLLLQKFWKGAPAGLPKGIFWGILALFLHSQIDFDLADPSLATYLFVLPALIPLKTIAIPAGRRGEHRRRSLTQITAGLIILVLLTAGFHLTKIHRAEKIYQNGLNLLSAGNGSQGLALLRKASEINPKNPAYYAQLGALLYRAGEVGKNQTYFQKSAYAYQKACKAEPYSAGLRFRLGLSAESVAEITGDQRWTLLAEQSFKDAVFLYPTKEEYRKKVTIK